MIKRIIAHTYMGDYGQMVDQIRVETETPVEGLGPEDFRCSDCFSDIGASAPTKGVTNVTADGCILTLDVDPFLYRTDFCVWGTSPALRLTVKKENIDLLELHHEDMFRACVENGVNYRLYEPQATGPRPLILFLHGGGGSGEDNMLQLTDTLGAIKLAERLPDMYIMAPQAPAGSLSMEEAFAKMLAKGDPFKVILGTDPDNDKEDRGWNREYLGRVCDVIRGMITDGKVDAHRVYVIGMSMGGFGTIKAVSIAPELFAAAVPICPSMNGESWPILANFPDVPVYIATAYIDHQAGRHAYILRAVQQLWEKGRKDVRYTIFTPEELAAYGIGTDPKISSKELYEQNHNSWILVLHNEYCILDWMLSHRKP